MPGWGLGVASGQHVRRFGTGASSHLPAEGRSKIFAVHRLGAVSRDEARWVPVVRVMHIGPVAGRLGGGERTAGHLGLGEPMRLVDKEGERSRMNEETFQRKLAELIAEIATLPAGEREKLELLAAQTRERHKQLKETVSSLQESIDFVRLSIKYLLFDLEATRRENAQLRKMLDENNPQ